MPEKIIEKTVEKKVEKKTTEAIPKFIQKEVDLTGATANHYGFTNPKLTINPGVNPSVNPS